ncbi:hypothetical protein, partial [Nostoc sp.]|uniref:hypothetical protein n=1 Tax=Nostoc sp. TaxID=1180 RepID=UPI002FFBEAEA
LHSYSFLSIFLLRKMFIMHSFLRGEPESKSPNLSGDLGDIELFIPTTGFFKQPLKLQFQVK